MIVWPRHLVHEVVLGTIVSWVRRLLWPGGRAWVELEGLVGGIGQAVSPVSRVSVDNGFCLFKANYPKVVGKVLLTDLWSIGGYSGTIGCFRWKRHRVSVDGRTLRME